MGNWRRKSIWPYSFGKNIKIAMVWYVSKYPRMWFERFSEKKIDKDHTLSIKQTSLRVKRIVVYVDNIIVIDIKEAMCFT